MLTKNHLRSIAGAALVWGTTACGGTAGSTAEMKISDAPPAGVTSVKLTIASIQAHVVADDKATDADPNDSSIDDDNNWVSLSLNKTIDLVQFQGEAAADTLGTLGLPVGKITQIRLVLDTSAPGNNVATVSGTVCNLGVAKVAKKGIKIDHVFKAFASTSGGKEQVWVDFRLDESMTANAAGCYDLDPHLELTHVKLDDVDVAL